MAQGNPYDSRGAGAAAGPRGSRIPGSYLAGGSSGNATLTTALSGTNNDLTFTAAESGPDGQDVSVRYVDPGSASQAIGVSVAGKDITVNLGSTAPQAATLTTSLAGADNDLTYTADTPGTGGNSITVEYVVAGNDTPLTVGVVSNAITVNVATDSGGLPTSTASDVAAAVTADSGAAALVNVTNAPSNSGAGVVDALAPTNLAGGAAYLLSTASQVAAAVNGDPLAHSLADAQNAAGNNGTGRVTALSKTNLGGSPTVSRGRAWRSGRRAQGNTHPYG